jgi:hypothetical protein
MNGPLSNKQKFYLSKDARRAWQKLGQPGTEAEFRRAQVAIATNGAAEGLSTASNSQYLTIKAHFETLEGATGRAMNTHLRATDEDLRQARHNLGTLLCENGFTPAYADAIAQDRFGCNVMDCTAEQVLQVVMTVKARVTKKGAKEGTKYHVHGTAPKRRDKKKPTPAIAPRPAPLGTPSPSLAAPAPESRNPLTESHA